MHRIDTPTAQVDKFGAGKNGFTDGDPTTGRRSTDLNSDMWDAVQEEICTVIEKSGLALNKEQHDQLYRAIVKLIAGQIPDALLRKNNLSDVMDKVIALDNIGGVPKTRKINGYDLSKDITLNPKDVGSLPLILTPLNVDLNTLGYTDQAGIYFQPLTANATQANHYPSSLAGTLTITPGAYGCSQEYTTYQGQKYTRALTGNFNGNGPWGIWVPVYTSQYPGEIVNTSANSYRIAYNGMGTFWRNDGNNFYLMLTNKNDPYGSYNSLRPLSVSLTSGNITFGHTVNAPSGVIAGYSGSFAWVDQYSATAPYYQDFTSSGTSEYHPLIKQRARLSTNAWVFSMGALISGTALSWHLHLRGSAGQEFNHKWDTSGNYLCPGQVIPSNYTNFDARYYTKSQSDAGYMPKTGAYTKTESDVRYLNDAQRGSQALWNSAHANIPVWEAPSGCYITGINIRTDLGDCRFMGYYYRALMIKTVSGSWRQAGN